MERPVRRLLQDSRRSNGLIDTVGTVDLKEVVFRSDRSSVR
jgi:hypothetical protein